MGEAWLRIALLKWYYAPAETRDAVRKAIVQRTSMSPRDQMLLRATETLLETPYAYEERRKRMNEAAARYPGDAEIAYHLAVAEFEMDFEDPRAITAFRRAAALDPKSAIALSDLAQCHGYLGELAQGHVIVDRAVAIAPNATAPLEIRDMFLEQEGECAKLELDARRQVSIHPDYLDAYERLAESVASQGRPVETVEEILRQKWAHAPGNEAKQLEMRDRVRLDQLRGDFESAEKRTLELQKMLATVNLEDQHAPVWRALVESLQEMGLGDRAARVAEDYLRRREGWVREPRAEDFAASKDAMSVMIDAAYRGGRLSDAQRSKKRDEFLAEWAGRSASGPISRYVWFYAWAQPATTREEALEAMRAADRYSPLPTFRPMSLALGFEGGARFLSGDHERGLALLERGARVCRVLAEPVRHTRLLLTVADAREARGDRAGACATLRGINERWSRARPKSITFLAARDRQRALACPRP
jgi:serine/threonine-protein kinase